jgi:hypothetical protein
VFSKIWLKRAKKELSNGVSFDHGTYSSQQSQQQQQQEATMTLQ